MEYQIRMEDLAHNIFRVRKQAAVPVWGVIKLDGYGMGLLFLARVLESCGVSRFAVSTVEELVRLRKAGFVRQDVLMLSPPATGEELEQILNQRGIFSVGSLELARQIQGLAQHRGRRARVHIKVDTGMGRFGFLPEEYESIRSLYAMPELSVEGIYSHFSCASIDPAFTRLQAARFSKILDRLAEDGISRGMAHLCNSPALFRYPELCLDAVRCGSALVGRVAGLSPAESGLRPVGRLAVPVAAVKTLPRGYHAGYGKRFVLSKVTQAAILPAGRWDGLPAIGLRGQLQKSRRPRAQLCGQSCPFLSSPGEGSTILDVSGLAVHPGDIAYLDLSPLRVNPTLRKVYL